jgi:outer membrane murein-binding lipoprotein Lpp
MAAGAKRSTTKRNTTTAGRGRATSKPTRATAKAPIAKGYKTAVRKLPAKTATPKPARDQTRRKASVGGATERLDSVLAARLEAIAHGLEQIGGLRADIEELRTQIGTIAQSVTTLAETVEAALSTNRRQRRNRDQPKTMAPDQASTEDAPDNQPASADEAEAEPSHSIRY